MGQHCEAVTWMLHFVKGTSDFGLLYEKSHGGQFKLKSYCDSDYSGHLDKRRSLTSYLFILFGNPISWKASLQY